GCSGLVRLGLNCQKPLCFQQSGDPGDTARNPFRRQLHRNPPSPVTPTVTPEHCADPRDQLPIPHFSPRLLRTAPCVEPGPADLQQVAHIRSPELFGEHQLIDPGVHVSHPSRPKMLNAFFRMSRSRSTRRSSASSSRTRASRPTAVAPPCCSSFRFQLYSRFGCDSPSRSQTDGAEWPSSSIRTASSLNSWVYCRRGCGGLPSLLPDLIFDIGQLSWSRPE